MHPVDFYGVSEVCSLPGFRMGMYKIQYVDFHVSNFTMTWQIEVSANCVIHFVDSDIPHVCLESVHKSGFCLAYILFTTMYASKAVN